MALTTINGRDGTANFSIGGVAYAGVCRSHEVESNVEQIDGSVFSTEGVPVWDPGMEDLRFRCLLKMTKGAAVSGNMIPAPQGVALVFTFSTSCTISMTGNFDRAVYRRTVNQTGIITAEGRSTGTFVVSWLQS